MFLDYGYRSECCYAPIKLGYKKIKNTDLHTKIWVCCNCDKRDVGIVKYNKNATANSTEPEFDKDDEPVID